MTVLIAGGGISGLTLALSCHQVGIPFKVFESVQKLKPLGVGINLQPSAVRELFDLGLEARLNEVGIQTRDYGMYSKKGHHIWTEPRGIRAGYKWPQYSVHRGQFHMMLYDELITRAGPDCILTGWAVRHFENENDQAVLHLENRQGETRIECGDIVIGADGIHSAIRAQIAPGEGDPIWGGRVLWRGTTRAVPCISDASMVMVGHDGLRIVTYPISRTDPDTGKALVNWIAILKFDSETPWNKEDYSRKANIDDFLHKFQNFRFDWLNVPDLVSNADEVFEYPMVDRDPLERWTHGRVTLIGDAAHSAYPVGSNGAGAGIIDARKLVARFLELGLTEAALQAYEAEMRPITNKIILTNRVAGPDQIMDVVEERSGGAFENIDDVIPRAELAAHSANYKRVAGFGIKETNKTPRTIPEGAAYQTR